MSQSSLAAQIEIKRDIIRMLEQDIEHSARKIQILKEQILLLQDKLTGDDFEDRASRFSE